MDVIGPIDPNSDQGRVQYVRWIRVLCKYLLVISAVWAGACGDLEPFYRCDYPMGPYAFTDTGDVVPPMRWRHAVAGAIATGSADLAALHCDSSVHSIFIHVGATYCPTCPDRLHTILEGEDVWVSSGAVWIFLVIDAQSGEAAGEYIDRQGISFGWRANDADNSWGADAVAHADLVAFQPWVGVIRAEDMVLVFSESLAEAPDLEGIAREFVGAGD